MINIIHIDSDWNHAIVEMNNQTYFMNPPYKSGRKINIDRPTKEYVASFKSPDDAQRYMMTVFASQNLHKIMLLWKKYSASGMGNVTLDKISDMAFKVVESDLRSGAFPEKELKELFTLHAGKGTNIDKRGRLSLLLKKHRAISPDKIDSFLLKISREPSPYDDRIDDILSYVDNILKSGKDPQTASFILTSLKINTEIGKDLEDKFENLFNKAKQKLVQKAKDNGESLAKPWQKYINPEPQYVRKGPIDNVNTSDWQETKKED